MQNVTHSAIVSAMHTGSNVSKLAFERTQAERRKVQGSGVVEGGRSAIAPGNKLSGATS